MPLAAPPAPAFPPVRVLLVDDSAVMRAGLARALAAVPELRVVGTAANGRLALDALRATPADVVVLDVEMPEMDGLTALPLLMRQQPGVRVLMLSAHGGRGAAVTLRALALGAADFVCKLTPGAGPAGESAAQRAAEHAADVARRIVAIGRGAQRLAARTAAVVPRDTAPAGVPAVAAATSPVRPGASAPAPRPMQVLAVASSTGGPVALTEFLTALPPDFDVPVVVTQHMPPDFTRLLAERLATATGRPCAEARDGEALQAGRVYVAPGDHHLRLERRGGAVWTRLTQEPPVHHCRPAADPMFASVATAYGAGTLGVVLTGMGQDGRDGAGAIVRAGGRVIVQDEASSVVWGMPGAVAQAGLAAAVLPVAQLAAHAGACCGGRSVLARAG